MRNRRRTKYDTNANKAILGGIINEAHMLAPSDTTAIAPRFSVVQLVNIGTSSTHIIHVLLTHYGIKKGLKSFGQKGDDVVNAEMQQLHDFSVMTPKPPPAVRKEDDQ